MTSHVTPSRVLFLGDLSRGAQAQNVRKTYHLFSPVFQELGVACEAYCSPINSSLAMEEWLPSWRIATASGDLSHIEAMQLDDHTAVVGFEMPDRYLAYLNERGIRWVNLAIHPLRFLADLHLEIRTSFAFDLTRLAVSRGEIEACVQAMRIKHGAPEARRHSTLAIFGQVPVDLSVYFDGEFKTLDKYFDAIDRIAAEHETVLYKPHPNLSNEAVDTALLRRYSAKLLDERNVYKLFASGAMSTACAISSSTITEAGAFGIRSVFLEPRARSFGPAISYPRLVDCSEFWQVGLLGQETGGGYRPISGAISDNFLRDSFEYWGFSTPRRELEGRIAHVDRSMDGVVNRLAELEHQIETATTTMSSRVEELTPRTELERKIGLVDRSMDGVVSRLAELEQQIDALTAIKASKSWRITAPLRSLSRVLHRVLPGSHQRTR